MSVIVRVVCSGLPSSGDGGGGGPDWAVGHPPGFAQVVLDALQAGLLLGLRGEGADLLVEAGEGGARRRCLAADLDGPVAEPADGDHEEQQRGRGANAPGVGRRRGRVAGSVTTGAYGHHGQKHRPPCPRGLDGRCRVSGDYLPVNVTVTELDPRLGGEGRDRGRARHVDGAVVVAVRPGSAAVGGGVLADDRGVEAGQWLAVAGVAPAKVTLLLRAQRLARRCKRELRLVRRIRALGWRPAPRCGLRGNGVGRGDSGRGARGGSEGQPPQRAVRRRYLQRRSGAYSCGPPADGRAATRAVFAP